MLNRLVDLGIYIYKKCTAVPTPPSLTLALLNRGDDAKNDHADHKHDAKANVGDDSLLPAELKVTTQVVPLIANSVAQVNDEKRIADTLINADNRQTSIIKNCIFVSQVISLLLLLGPSAAYEVAAWNLICFFGVADIGFLMARIEGSPITTEKTCMCCNAVPSCCDNAPLSSSDRQIADRLIAESKVELNVASRYIGANEFERAQHERYESKIRALDGKIGQAQYKEDFNVAVAGFFASSPQDEKHNILPPELVADVLQYTGTTDINYLEPSP